MAKKKKPRAPAASPSAQKTYELGDLRAVEGYVKDYLKGNVDDVVSDLQSLGRDAAGILGRLADEHQHEELRALAKRLIAVPPTVKTNLMTLRELSITALVVGAHANAPNATDLRELSVPGNAVALFDPQRLSASIVKGGRPRKNVDRVRTGDVAWFAVEGAGPVSLAVMTSPPPEGQPVVKLRLIVDSGIVFVGRPEASDGPRLGEIRLDPFITNLHAHLGSGRLVKLKPGCYVAAAHRSGDSAVRVYLTPDPAADDPAPPVELGALISLPQAVANGDIS